MVGAPKVVVPNPRNVELTLFWQRLGRIVARLLGQRAHCNIVITMKDGVMQNVRVDESFLPGNLPEV